MRWILLLSFLLIAIPDAWGRSYTKTFTFDSTLESFAEGTSDCADGVVSADTGAGNPAGSAKARVSGRNNSCNSWGMTLTGVTWESFGVPAGSTVVAVDGDFDWSCTEYTTGSTTYSGRLRIASSDCTTTANVLELGNSSVTGTTSWATTDASGNIAISAANQASSTSLCVTMLSQGISTGNSSSAAVSINWDNIVLNIVYNRRRMLISRPGFLLDKVIGPVVDFFVPPEEGVVQATFKGQPDGTFALETRQL